MAQPMFSMQQTVLTPLKSQKPSGCGCLGGGCMIGLVILFLLVGALVWGAWSTLNGLRSMTSGEARQIAVFAATQDQYNAVAAKLKAFETAYDAGEAAELTLTADEINTLIARHPDWSVLKGRAFVTISGSRIAMQMSVPLSQVRTFTDRWFNGEASMAFITEKGQARPVAISVKANGNEFPTWLIRYITSKDFVESLDVPALTTSSGVVTNLISAEVRDDQLVIKAKKK